jgi:hypothetical protein
MLSLARSVLTALSTLVEAMIPRQMRGLVSGVGLI